MAQIDQKSRAVRSSALNVQVISSDTTTVGSIIDTADNHSLNFTIHAGTITTGTFTPLIEESEDSGMSGSNVVSTDYLIGATASATAIANATFSTSADSNKVKSIGYVGKKRYVRLSIVTTSTGNGLIGAVAEQSNPGVASIDALT